jgi:uncharacterized protein (DUF1778 family)
MPQSVRLDPELERQVHAAAALEGVSVSDFIRTAARERAERVLGEKGPTLWEQIQPYVLEPTGETYDLDARSLDEQIGEEIEKAYARKLRSRQHSDV